MADFSDIEKINLAFKHIYGLTGTSNQNPSAGKAWYEELVPGTHIIKPSDIWSDSDDIPNVTTQSDARIYASTSGSLIVDRSQDESVMLSPNGSNWNISTTVLVPAIGMTIVDVFPSPSITKTLTNVVDNGGGNYTITLNNNIGISAGGYLLNSRVILTEDPTTNGLAWFARVDPNNPFSDRIQNFLQPQLYGQGYTVRLFEADGTEIPTTLGAWIFNWQQGILLFGAGFTADDEGYAKPLYLEAFTYNGKFGGNNLPDGTIHDTLRYDGTDWVASSSLQNDDIDVYVQNRLSVSGTLVMASGGTTPTGTLDPTGELGEWHYDSNYVYLKTPIGWKRWAAAEFEY